MSRARRDVWRRLIDFSFATSHAYRRPILAATALPQGRFRILRLIQERPRTLVELAEATGSDAPATTVIVTDLVERGLVERAPHPTNGRCKLVTLTPSGRATIAKGRAVMDEPPLEFAMLDADDLAALDRILDKLGP